MDTAAPTALELLELSVEEHSAWAGPTTALRVDLGPWLGAPQPQRLGVLLSWGPPPTGTSLPPVAMVDPLRAPALGVYWRTPLSPRMHLDVSTWARAPQRGPMPDALDPFWLHRQTSYGTRLEVRWAAARYGGLLTEFGAIGIKMEGSSQLVLRARKGGPMVYYRARF